MVSARRVVLLCGPPGAGKTTRARQLAEADGLEVFDRDDPRWSGDREFRLQLARVAVDPHARAVVIRSGATRQRRLAAVELCGATEVEVLTPTAELCRQRVRERGRHDWRRSLPGIGKWFDEYDHDEPTGPPDAAGVHIIGSRDW